jgi:hypothetical protein
MLSFPFFLKTSHTALFLSAPSSPNLSATNTHFHSVHADPNLSVTYSSFLSVPVDPNLAAIAAPFLSVLADNKAFLLQQSLYFLYLLFLTFLLFIPLSFSVHVEHFLSFTRVYSVHFLLCLLVLDILLTGDFGSWLKTKTFV